MPLDKDQIDELKAQVAVARKRELSFGLCLGKSVENTVLLTHRIKGPEVLAIQAKKAGETAKIAFGTMTCKGKNLMLACVEDPPPGTARKTKEFLKGVGLKMKVKILDAAGNTLEEDGDEDEEGEEDGTELEEGLAEEDPLAAEWERTLAKVDPVVLRYLSADLGDSAKVRAFWMQAVEVAGDGDYGQAIRIARNVVALMAAGREPAGTDGPAGAKWVAAFSKIQPHLDEVLELGTGEPDKMRAIWEFARGKAEGGDFAAATGALAPLAKLIAEARAAAPRTPAPDGEVQGPEAREKLAAAFATASERMEPLVAKVLKGDGDQGALRAAWDEAQALAKQDRFGDAIKALHKVKDLLQRAPEQPPTGAGDGAPKSEVAARKQAVLDRLAALVIPDGVTDSERPMMNGQRNLVTAAMQSDAPSEKDFADAEQALKTLQGLIMLAGQRMRTEDNSRAKAQLLDRLQGLKAPAGALPAEVAKIEAQRKTGTDALVAASPTAAQIETATNAVAEMTALITLETRRIAARRTQLEADHRKHDADIRRLLGLPGDTRAAAQLQRALTAHEARFPKLLDASELDKAETLLATIGKTVAALKTEETAMAPATALRQKMEAERKALEPTLKQARAMFVVSPRFVDDVGAFRAAERFYASYLVDGHYKRLPPQLDKLAGAARILVGRKAEFDEAVAARETVNRGGLPLVRKSAEAMQVPLTKPQAQALMTRFAEKGAAMGAAMTPSPAEEKHSAEWVTAAALMAEVDALADQLLAIKAECEAELARFDAASRTMTALKARFDPLLAAEAVLPDYERKKEEVEQQVDAYWHYYDDVCDAAKVDEALAALAPLVDQLAALAAANAEAIARRSASGAEYTKIRKRIDAAVGILPNSDPVLRLYDTFVKAREDFATAHNAGADTAMGLLDPLKAALEALEKGAKNNDRQRSKIRKAFSDKEAATEPKIAAAKEIIRQSWPLLSDLDAEIAALNDRLADLVGGAVRRYLDAIKVYEKLEDACTRVAARQPDADTRVARYKVDFGARYTNNAGFLQQIAAVLAYEDVTPTMQADQQAVGDLKNEIEANGANDEWRDGVEGIDKLEPMVAKLVAFKPAYDTLKADMDAVDTDYTANKPDLDAATAMQPVSREVGAAVTAYAAAWKAMIKPYEAKDFSAARTALPAAIAAAKEAVKLKSAHDTALAKQDAVNDGYGKISADIEKAQSFRGLTPEIAKLVDSFALALADFRAAYFGYDYDAALALLDGVEKGAKALLAKEAEHDAADKAAATRAAAAEGELDAITDTDLKAKSTGDKLKLLDELRGQKNKLTDKQRELQRKIYAAMDLDPEFKAVDDSRRGKLFDGIRGDTELMGAKDTWKTLDDAERVRLLMKPLKLECELYGMPVPEIELFSEPPGDLGSFNRSTNTMRVNAHPEATFDDFYDTLDTFMHENAHNYQAHICKKLEEGLIEEGDPEYKQALMFKANWEPFGYVNGKEDRTIYEKQPLEEHAWRTGGEIQRDLKKPANPPKVV